MGMKDDIKTSPVSFQAKLLKWRSKMLIAKFGDINLAENISYYIAILGLLPLFVPCTIPHNWTYFLLFLDKFIKLEMFIK